MRLLTGRNHPHFNLNGGLAQGIQTVVRAAKDPIASEPQDEVIIALLQSTLCRAKLDRDSQQWEITSVLGTKKLLSYSASIDDWKEACNSLLQADMTNDQPR